MLTEIYVFIQMCETKRAAFRPKIIKLAELNNFSDFLRGAKVRFRVVKIKIGEDALRGFPQIVLWRLQAIRLLEVSRGTEHRHRRDDSVLSCSTHLAVFRISTTSACCPLMISTRRRP